MSGAAVRAVKGRARLKHDPGQSWTERVPLLAGAVAAAMVAVRPSAAQAAGADAVRRQQPGSCAHDHRIRDARRSPTAPSAGESPPWRPGNTLMVMPGNYTGGVTLGAVLRRHVRPADDHQVRHPPRGAVINASATAGITAEQDLIRRGRRASRSTARPRRASAPTLQQRDDQGQRDQPRRVCRDRVQIANGIELSGTTSSTVSGNYLHDN